MTREKRTLEAFLDLAEERSLPIDRRKARILLDYEALIREWSTKVSLVSRKDMEHGLDKHFLDSVLIQGLISRGSEVVDLGSGAGFPGVPLAITRDDLVVHLVEVRRKKAFFLKEVKRRLGLDNIHVHPVSWETLVMEADYALSRATGNLEGLLSSLPHLLRPGGRLLLYSGVRTRNPAPLKVVELDNPLRETPTFVLIYSIKGAD